MIRREVHYSEMSIKEMFVMHNGHAAKIGKPSLRKRPTDRVEMVRALATILTFRPPPPVLVRDVVTEELCRISHYLTKDGKTVSADAVNDSYSRKGLKAVGFAYNEIAERVKKRVPNSRMTAAQLKVHNSNIQSGKKGYRKVKLPHIRLRSTLKEPTKCPK